MSEAIPGRAETAAQKRAVVEAVLATWLRHPQMRLGQLLYVATMPRDLFYVEDDELVAELEREYWMRR